ncbi:hypothetical protein [Ensifer sp. LCM 4579]|uniref:hypothetical protein n=1 Tax=Ensifer sp. LCM 4579 TaxID=1848292 RepID=UPI0008DAED5B|nr:hypothetical protein [Ensifer sp. LCM 4579]OHV80985.1 hypothetical protein LCM4579_21160 [Ensifer sp. LCM 4579]
MNEPLFPAPFSRNVGFCGGLSAGLALCLALFEPTALFGWLTAFLFWSSVPLGALCLVMMMRLISGAWRDELGQEAEAALLLLPLAALALIPLLFALPVLYGWVKEPVGQGFRGIYLSRGIFVGRTAVFLIAAGGIAALLLMRRRSSAIGALGLIAFMILHTMFAVDWVMSLDPHFHSSGLGLYLLSIETVIAIAFLLLLKLIAGPPPNNTDILGGVLFCALLIWAYFAFMQYLIIWSTNFPPGVLWYEHRAEGMWSPVEYAIGTLALVPALLLLFEPIRGDARWLALLCLSTLLGKALEVAWLVLPAASGPPLVSFAATVLAFAGMGAVCLSAMAAALRIAPRIGRERSEGKVRHEPR